MRKILKIIVVFAFFLFFFILLFEAQLLIVFPFWLLIVFSFLAGSFFSFLLIPHRKGFRNIEVKDWLYVLIYGFIISEIVLVLIFWPFNSITTASVLLVVFFVMWDIWSYEKKNKLTISKVIIDLIISIISISVLLATTKWLP